MKRRRASLKGWWKCLPLLGLGFSALFVEAWLNTEILRNQYQTNELATRIGELESQIAELDDERHHLKRMERMDAKAPDLGLVEPSPGQIKVVTVNGERPAERTGQPYVIARRIEDAADGATIARLEPERSPESISAGDEPLPSLEDLYETR